MARIDYTDDALADLEKIDGDARKAILKAIRDKLGTAPEQFGDQLGRRRGGNLTPFRKLKVGRNSTYRVVYHVHHDDHPDDPICVIVWIVAKRSDDQVYQDALARLQTMGQRETASQLEQALVQVWER